MICYVQYVVNNFFFKQPKTLVKYIPEGLLLQHQSLQTPGLTLGQTENTYSCIDIKVQNSLKPFSIRSEVVFKLQNTCSEIKKFMCHFNIGFD